MKLLISFLSILSLGNAVNHHHPLRLSDAQLEKLQSRMLLDDTTGVDVNIDGTCYSNMVAILSNDELMDIGDDNTICTEDQRGENRQPCVFNNGNSSAVDQIADMCNDLDGRVKALDVIQVCNDITLDDVQYDLYDFIGIPQCVPNICTDGDAIASMDLFISQSDEASQNEECVPDISFSFVVQDKNAKSMKGSKKQKSSPKSKKTKNAKNTKGGKKSKSKS